MKWTLQILFVCCAALVSTTPGISQNINSISDPNIPFIACQDLGESIQSKDHGTMSFQADTSCQTFVTEAQIADDQFRSHDAYSLWRSYIEQCVLKEKVYLEFSAMTNDCSSLQDEGHIIWAQYRNWLKKVLYNDPDSNYYCSDIVEYGGTFEDLDELGNTPSFKTELAILKYVSDSGHCFSLRFYRKDVIHAYYLSWKDTVRDSVKTPFDTTTPNIDQVGQSFLRVSAGVAASSGNLDGFPIENLQALKNPFKSELSLKYTVVRPIVAKIEVYDAIGRQMYSDGLGYLEPGDRTARINSSGWPSGSYYVRFITIQGAVRTLKVILKE